MRQQIRVLANFGKVSLRDLTNFFINQTQLTTTAKLSMKIISSIFGLLLFIGIAIAVYAVAIYNRLVTLKNRFKNAFAQIDVQLKRRYDLIPNLVESAKGYIKHERETLEAVIAARNQAQAASKAAAANPADGAAMAGLIGAEQVLGGALGKLIATVEAYPELKADQAVQDLMEELSSTENKIAFARQAYNDSVMTYNTAIESFPANLFATSFGFTQAELFKIEIPTEKEAPQVSLT